MRLLREANEIPETGDWGIDCHRGSELGGRLLREALETQSPLPLTSALKDMVEKGRWSGVEVGVAFALAQAAL